MTMPFAIQFLVISLIFTLLLGVILLIRTLFHQQLTAAYRYRLWKLFLVTLTLPFLPLAPIVRALILLTSSAAKNRQTLSLTGPQGLPAPYSNSNLLGDDAILTVTSPSFSQISCALLILWILGVLGMMVLTLRANRPFFHSKRRAYPASLSLQNLLTDCEERLGHFLLPVRLYSAPSLSSPMACGIWHRRILLPEGLDTMLCQEELRHILLHELIHIRNRDVIWNHLITLLQILYWFHPAVWFACRQARAERETACDALVLALLGTNQSTAYGHTLLNFAQMQTNSHPSLSLATEIGGSSKLLKKRILSIANHKPTTSKQRAIGSLLLVFVLIISLTSIPYLTVSANSRTSSALGKHIIAEDYSQEFSGLEGSMVWLSAKDQTYHIYHPSDSLIRRSPNSTYKIYSALLALESGSITPDNSDLLWDTTEYAIMDWNQNQNLDTAMARSVNWYFQRLDQQSGSRSVSQFITDLNYGNQDTSGDLSTFWLESTLTISPLEQVDLLQNLITNQFPNRTFQQSSIDAIHKSLYLSESNGRLLYGKTGSSVINNKDHTGWFIGYVEHADNTYYFATSIRDQKQATGALASTITQQILLQEGIY